MGRTRKSGEKVAVTDSRLQRKRLGDGSSWCLKPVSEEGAIVEHVGMFWDSGPVVALAQVARFTGDLDERVIE